jgi:hypothetical protein
MLMAHPNRLLGMDKEVLYHIEKMNFDQGIWKRSFMRTGV